MQNRTITIIILTFLITIILGVLTLIWICPARGEEPYQVAGVGGLMMMGGGVPSAACDDTTGMLVAEEFTTGSLPDGWTEAAAGLVYNYTTSPAPLRGTYSCESPGGLKMSYVSFAGSGTIYFHFLFNTTWPVAQSYWLWIMDSSGGNTALISINTDGTIYGTHNTVAGTGYTAMTSGTTYHIWGLFTKGAGTGILRTWVGATANRADAAQNLNIETGDGNTDIARFGIGTGSDNVAIFDQIRIKTTEFTTVCP